MYLLIDYIYIYILNVFLKSISIAYSLNQERNILSNFEILQTIHKYQIQIKKKPTIFQEASVWIAWNALVDLSEYE